MGFPGRTYLLTQQICAGSGGSGAQGKNLKLKIKVLRIQIFPLLLSSYVVLAFVEVGPYITEYETNYCPEPHSPGIFL